MTIGIAGIGRMGLNMLKRLHERGHDVAAYNFTDDLLKEPKKLGLPTATTLKQFVSLLKPPRQIIVMLPHGEITRTHIEQLLPLLKDKDIIVDGGNSHYKESMQLAEQCRKAGVYFLDAGISGGIWGRQKGYNIMVGGPKVAFKRMEPVFKSLAPDNGYAHVSPKNGAGHFVKMMHNALEYAMLQSIGETFESLRCSEFDLDLKQVSQLWNNGAVVRSWLLELLTKSLESNGQGLDNIQPFVEDSDMGRWAAQFAVEQGIPLPTITQALYERFASRIDQRFSNQIIAALRKEFGGHAVKAKKRSR